MRRVPARALRDAAPPVYKPSITRLTLISWGCRSTVGCCSRTAKIRVQFPLAPPFHLTFPKFLIQLFHDLLVYRTTRVWKNHVGNVDESTI